MADTHEYQQHMAISNSALRCDHSSTSKKKKRNLLGKLIKSCGLTITTTNYHQYYSGMTTTKKSRRKNLPRILTKSEKPTITRKD
ncbi:hypothetical protein G9A89_016332 [Geosiphon pyriformis]|nr:hypothetical protein G9A89_016332 [Geosiphon pyriformis]